MSGNGGSKTFKVSAPGDFPPVALHCLGEEVAPDPVSEQRLAAAQVLFAKHGLCPTRLAEGGDWFCESWGGVTLGQAFSLNSPEVHAPTASIVGLETAGATHAELGALLARVHQLPTDWFDPWRAQLKSKYPGLANAPDTSPIWWSTGKSKYMLAFQDDELLAKYVQLQACVHPDVMTTTPGKRLVTAHADFHPGNLLRI